ncbi:MAG TPA: PIG-L family deacetylase [Humibacter sp.]|nr:PIG-L family deacetylase [Humibacter sp.]
MVKFDPQTTTTAAAAWESDPAWSHVPSSDPDAICGSGLVVWCAHPDDETLGVGGLIAEAYQRSLPVHVVAATGDDERWRELRAALALMHPDATVSSLGLPDGSLHEHQHAVAEAIETTLDDYPHRVILTPWSEDRHGDHRTLGQLVRSIAHDHGRRCFSYPVWLWQWGESADVPWSDLMVIPLGEESRRRKHAALEVYASQVSGPYPILSDEFLENARMPREVVILEPTPADRHFEHLHATRADPWNVEHSWYEIRKRRLLMATLPRDRYRSILELGCSTGVATRQLADRADALLAVDGSLSAVSAARDRTRFLTNTKIERMRLPFQWPEGRYDLIVVSELGYYFDSEDWQTLCARMLESLVPDGEVIACHWTGESHDFRQSGRNAHRVLAEAVGHSADLRHHDDDFVIELFRKRAA